MARNWAGVINSPLSADSQPPVDQVLTSVRPKEYQDSAKEDLLYSGGVMPSLSHPVSAPKQYQGCVPRTLCGGHHVSIDKWHPRPPGLSGPRPSSHPRGPTSVSKTISCSFLYFLQYFFDYLSIDVVGCKLLTVTDFGGRFVTPLRNKASRLIAVTSVGHRNGWRLY
jgi:hypothetical protein